MSTKCGIFDTIPAFEKISDFQDKTSGCIFFKIIIIQNNFETTSKHVSESSEMYLIHLTYAPNAVGSHSGKKKRKMICMVILVRANYGIFGTIFFLGKNFKFSSQKKNNCGYSSSKQIQNNFENKLKHVSESCKM